jgi:DNA integrity scanning protein DisA with diadenylate cyclase activity
MKDSNIYIVTWDMTGLECVIDANELQSEDVMRALRGQKGSKLGEALFYLTMRARANSQRHYEIYSIHTNSEISKEDLERMFEENPQNAADLIRDRGVKIYSDRANQKVQVIT